MNRVHESKLHHPCDNRWLVSIDDDHNISSFITRIKLFLISGDAIRHVDYNYLGSQDVPRKDHFNISFLKLFWKCHRECDFGSVCTRSFTKNEDIIHLYWLLLYLMDDGHTDCMTKALYTFMYISIYLRIWYIIRCHISMQLIY